MRLVLDTSILVVAIRSNAGASQALLRMGLRKRFILLASVPLMIEYQAVMKRKEHLSAAGLAADDVEVLLDAIAAVCEPVRLAYLWRPSAPDPNDDMVLETAFNGQADAIVTFNLAHLSAPASRLGIAVLRPGAALKELRKNDEKE